MGGVLGSRWRGATGRSLTQFRIPLPEGAVAAASFNKRVAISPDGTHVAFNLIQSVSTFNGSPANEKFFLHSLRELEPKVLPAAGGAAFLWALFRNDPTLLARFERAQETDSP